MHFFECKTDGNGLGSLCVWPFFNDAGDFPAVRFMDEPVLLYYRENAKLFSDGQGVSLGLPQRPTDIKFDFRANGDYHSNMPMKVIFPPMKLPGQPHEGID